MGGRRGPPPPISWGEYSLLGGEGARPTFLRAPRQMRSGEFFQILGNRVSSVAKHSRLHTLQIHEIRAMCWTRDSWRRKKERLSVVGVLCEREGKRKNPSLHPGRRRLHDLWIQIEGFWDEVLVVWLGLAEGEGNCAPGALLLPKRGKGGH